MQDIVIDMECPNCNRKLKVKMKEMYPGNHKRCVCGCRIDFKGADGRKTQRSFDELQKAIRRLGR